MLEKSPYFAGAAVLLFLPAYAIFSDSYTGNAFTWILQALGNVVHLGWMGVPFLVGGISLTTLAFRQESERDERALS